MLPAKAKLDKVLIGLFCTEISIKSFSPLNAKALISVMLLESKFNFFNLVNLEKAATKRENNWFLVRKKNSHIIHFIHFMLGGNIFLAIRVSIFLIDGIKDYNLCFPFFLCMYLCINVPEEKFII